MGDHDLERRQRGTCPSARAYDGANRRDKPAEREGGKQKFLGFEEPRYEAPLIYSTELSRSVRLREPQRALDTNEKTVPNAKLQAKKANGAADGLMKDLDYWRLADELTYGLINVRTDGERIRMAVLKENQASFQVESFDV